ncbi:MAG TPA: RodZ domain-containing protein [Streptosporangiaceae bacterium]
MSIGDTLAEARRQAGLTITQVSQRTCIRETIIRGIERGDYSACGGDFYARGHIRSIARAVGVDPEPLIREYDATQGAPASITAADVFEPATPIKIRERRRPNWSLAMALALLLIVGLVAWRIADSRASTHSASTPPASDHDPAPAGLGTSPSPSSSPSVAPRHPANQVVIRLTAAQTCWVWLTTASGKTIFQGDVLAGSAKAWTERQAVNLELGNPGGITLTVNGKVQSPAAGHPVTLSFGPGQQVSSS